VVLPAPAGKPIAGTRSLCPTVRSQND
jgi:hypothetical protein